MTPRELNGYPVLHREDHRNGVFTVMVERGEDDYAVATWWADLGATWSWGHYSTSYDVAAADFKQVAARNAKRGRN